MVVAPWVSVASGATVNVISCLPCLTTTDRDAVSTLPMWPEAQASFLAGALAGAAEAVTASARIPSVEAIENERMS